MQAHTNNTNIRYNLIVEAYNTIYTSKPIAELIDKSFHLFVLKQQLEINIVINK